MKHVVIVGGGFAGIRTARKLKNQKDVAITLINDSEDFRYCPALYRAATGFKLGTARLPLEWMLLDNSRAQLVTGRASVIDTKKKVISLESGAKIDYDFAVLALGSVTTYFNIDGLHDHSFGIKTAEEILHLRQHLHEKIVNKSHLEENYVIIGGGPTGVELAGAFGAYLQRIEKRHKVKAHSTKIWLIEAAPRILPQMNEHASKLVARRLRKIGVNIAVNTRVKAETIHTLKTSEGTIKTHTVIWTAGTALNPFYKLNEQSFTFTDKGKIAVDEHLQARPNVYVIGDNAGTKYSGTALTAISHGNFTAKDIIARLQKARRPKTYERAPIQVVPAGKSWAVLQYHNFVLSGKLVSLMRRAADYIGYSDVLGPLRALTIWSNSDIQEDGCQICQRQR